MKRKGGFNSAAATVTGAIVGAGVALAGAIVLKDKKNRVKVKQVLNKVKKITKLAKDTGKKVKKI